MKKSLLILTFLFAFSLPAMAASFPDVPEDHPNYKAIEYLKENDILHGYQDNTFGPDNGLTRAEAMKIVSRAFDVPFEGDYEKKFSDVEESDWFFPYVMGAYEDGIVQGYADGSFGPNNPVSKAESLKMILLAADAELEVELPTFIFVDVDEEDWFAEYAYFARQKNILLGDEEAKIYPSSEVNRAIFAEMVYRMRKVLENGGEEFEVGQSWPAYEGKDLPFIMRYDDSTWELTENSEEVVFFHPDDDFAQFSPARLYPDTGVVRVTLDRNEQDLSSSQYFNTLEAAFPDAEITEFSWEGYEALEVLQSNVRRVDWYIYLDEGYVLAVFTEYGDGVLSYKLKKYIQAMVGSMDYKKVDFVDYEAILSEIFENILVEGKGMQILNLLPEKVIIETDSIGVGTGPVDYYYSDSVDYTFKYERASDVILDKREGSTSAF